MPDSVASTPRGSVSGASFHGWAQNGTGSDLKMALVVRSDMNMVRHATALPVIRPVCTHEAGRSSLICMKRKLHALLWLRF